MIVKKVWLKNYRNYSNLEISFSKEKNIIIGKNAQGKTNLLESFVYLSLTRSHRTSNDQNLIQFDKPLAKIGCELEDDIDKKLEVVIHPNGKTLLLNQNPISKSSQFVGILNVVLFSPDDLSVFQDAPRERRKLMDQEIIKISPSYLNALNNYQKLLKNRNTLLKEKKIDETYLEILEEQLITEAAVIIQKRTQFLNQINQYYKTIYQQLSNEQTDIQLIYQCCVEQKKDLKEELKELIQRNKQKDIETHMTNVGIHREDIQFVMNEKNVTQIASQGQKRMMLLGFKFSLLQTIEHFTKKKPIILLDDVLSELDQDRQRKLFEMLEGPYQSIITTTNLPSHLKLNNAKIFYIEQGSVKEATHE